MVIKQKPVAEAFHPATYILEEIKERKMALPAFLSKLMDMGICMHYMMKVLREKRPVNNIVAIGLSQLFGTSEEIWLNLQNEYDNHPTIKKTKVSNG